MKHYTVTSVTDGLLINQPLNGGYSIKRVFSIFSTTKDFMNQKNFKIMSLAILSLFVLIILLFVCPTFAFFIVGLFFYLSDNH